MLDSHCHINLNHFGDDLEAAIERMLIDGVRGVLNVGFDPDTARETIDLIERYPFIFGVVGCHPHDAQVLDDEFEAVLRDYLTHDRVIGIGEIGLDYYRDLSPREVQNETFRRMIRLGREKSVPVVIHCRDAFDDVMAVLRDESDQHRGIFHAFAGTPEEAQQITDMGFHIGVGGVVTFQNSQLAKTLETVPLENVVLETDSPYLTPSPFRGKRNEPAYVAHVARMVARINGVTPQEVSRITDENFCRAMGLSPGMLPGPVYRLENTVYIHSAAIKPDGLEALDAFGDDIEGMVLCGLDDPLASPTSLENTLAVAARGREKEWHVSVSTDGRANALAERDITPELADVVDEIVVLFHGTTPSQHDRTMLTSYGAGGFEEMKDFVRCSVAAGMNAVCEFIATPKFNPEPCRELARSLKAQYDIRMYGS